MKLKRKHYLAGGILLVAALAAMLLWHSMGRKQEGALLKTTVKKGPMDITVITTGELQAQNSEDIKGPFEIRQAGLNQLKISDLVPEGTVVKAGDYIATLDRNQVNQKIKDLYADLNKIQSLYTQTRLDTTLEMRKLRDDLINQKYDMEEKQLNVQQSKYEPPATIRQAEIEYDRAKRGYAQQLKSYEIKLQQNRAKMKDVAAQLEVQNNKIQQMNELMERFTIKAPKGGMVIYKKDWFGKKIKAGSDVSGYDPTVATLPDLSVMISQTYVNEIDISKLKAGQPVNITIDAFPGKRYTGKVLTIANIGEQLPSSDTKVFEVTISINEKDTLLRPAMTTSNSILTASLPASTLYIPLDCVQGNDTISYVFKADGGNIVRQEIVVGATSNESAEIKAGLTEGEQVYMSVPPDADKIKLVRLPAGVKAKIKKQPAKAAASVPSPTQSKL